MNISDKVYNYPTKYKEGFVELEIQELLKEYPDIDMDRFNECLNCNTCMVKGNDIIQYHCDVLKALYFGIKKDK
jgi:hypothetical protein